MYRDIIVPPDGSALAKRNAISDVGGPLGSVLTPVRVLLLDSDPRTRGMVKRVLEERGHLVEPADDCRSAEANMAADDYEVALVDIDHCGHQAFPRLAQSRAGLRPRVVVMSDAPCAHVPCLKKPFDADQLFSVVEVATPEERSGTRLIGRSQQMQRVHELIERVATTPATVLIQGETGTGKELVAKRIHERSKRAGRSFIPVNCSALSETLLESELFGHTKGSFTGAVADRRGLFEEASGGTLFLDEISTIPAAIQVKLLRVIQERAIQRVGTSTITRVDFRLIVATNVDLASEVAAGRFRADLFFRLNVFTINVPPLRERDGDIPLLISYFRRKYSEEYGLPAPVIDAGILAELSRESWRGNVRELEHCVERAVILQDLDAARATGTTDGENSGQRELLALAESNQWDLARLEREYVMRVLRSCRGHRGRAARILGIDERTLYRKLKLWN